MASSCHHSKISITLYFKRELHRKLMIREIGYGILNEIKELDLDYMEHGYMRIEGRKRGHATSRNLKVVVKSHMMLFDIFEIVKRNFMSVQLVRCHIHSIWLIHEQINK